jgi:hypothetical protein
MEQKPSPHVCLARTVATTAPGGQREIGRGLRPAGPRGSAQTGWPHSARVAAANQDRKRVPSGKRRDPAKLWRCRVHSSMRVDRRAVGRAVVGLAVGLFISSRASATETTPYGPGAPWNLPVAGLALHPQSGTYRDRLWSGGANPVGNINLTFDGYTYPVYDARQATGLYSVHITGSGNLNGKTIPWNIN